MEKGNKMSLESVERARQFRISWDEALENEDWLTTARLLRTAIALDNIDINLLATLLQNLALKSSLKALNNVKT